MSAKVSLPMFATSRAEDGRRLALIIATSIYEDAGLSKLRAPGRDAQKLADVLGETAIGNFDVDTLLDAPVDVLRRRIAQFCAATGPRDLALLYFSCHGVLDDRGRLHYATVDTDRSLLSVTALQAAWLNEQLEDSRCRKQILLLDCCHSGAFARAKGGQSLALRQQFESRGRAVLTASRATEYSFESGEIVREDPGSVFTEAVVKGLRTGDADGDSDGMVTVAELYEYTYHTVLERGVSQTPSLWTYGAEGTLLVALNPRGGELPTDVKLAIRSPWPKVREGAVSVLAELLSSRDAGLADGARRELVRIAGDDVSSVADSARKALGVIPAPVADRLADTEQPTERLSGRPPKALEPESGISSPGVVREDSHRRRWTRTRGFKVLLAGTGLLTAVALVVLIIDSAGRTARDRGGSGTTAEDTKSSAASPRVVLGPPRLSDTKPSCPSSPCFAISRTTGFTTKADALRNPMRVPRTGNVVTWSIKQSRPNSEQVAFFNDTLGGRPRAGIAVLRPVSGDRYTLAEASPVQSLTRYFGRTATFRLERPLPVLKDDVVALTVPTWVAAMRVDRSGNSSWRSSRSLANCRRTTRQTAHLELGSAADYACSYAVALVAYAATLDGAAGESVRK